MLKNKKSGYSVIASILIVGFLLVLTSGVFHLVLSELNDNRGRENYLRASAGAEGALELALLSIKQKGYGYYDSINATVNNESILLSRNPLDTSLFRKSDIRISYDMDSKVSTYSGSLSSLGFDIIPLFYIDDGGMEKRSQNIELIIPSGEADISWNIVSDNGGISGTGGFIGDNLVKVKTLGAGGFSVSDIKVTDFLSDTIRNSNYLILFNTNPSNEIQYDILSTISGEFFTKPRAEIISSAQVGEYKQSFRTTVDNTEYLNVLKYSIFSN